MSIQEDNIPPTKIWVLDSTDALPPRLLSKALLLDAVIHPPNYGGNERTREDVDRHRERIKDQIRIRPEDVLNFDLFGGKKLKLPVKGGQEPRFTYGRDQDGQGKGKGKSDNADDPSPITYEMTPEEFLLMLLDDAELPYLLKKQLSMNEVKTYRCRGNQAVGPRQRLNREETARARMRRAIALRNCQPERFPEESQDEGETSGLAGGKKRRKIPTPKQVPFAKNDLVYHRIEEIPDKMSNAAVVMLLDVSGSMESVFMIAKVYFAIMNMFLKVQYENVALIMIVYNETAEIVDDERKFFQVKAGGGTHFAPGLQLSLDVVNDRYPASSWNRYLFQATDGQAYDNNREKVLGDLYAQILSQFNYMGYLEIDASNSDWDAAGKILKSLPPELRQRLGMSKVQDLQDVANAAKRILIANGAGGTV